MGHSAGCSQNDGPLLVRDDISGYQNGTVTLGTTQNRGIMDFSRDLFLSTMPAVWVTLERL